MLRNGDLLTDPVEVSKQFYIMGIVFHQSLLGIQYKWKTDNSMDHLLSAINYQEHKCLICRELKVVGLVLGIQGVYTKYPSFLSLWDSWADN